MPKRTTSVSESSLLTTSPSIPVVLSVHSSFDESNIPLEAAAALSPDRFQVHAVSLRQPQRVARRFIEDVYPESHITPHGFGLTVQHPRTCFRAVALLRELKPSIVHVHHSASALLFALWARILRVPVICTTIHNDFRFYSTPQKLIYSTTLGLTDHVICNSRNTLLQLKAHAWKRLRDDRLHVCYNGVNLEHVCSRPVTGPSPFLRDSSPFHVGTVARLVPQKDLRTLVLGFAQFHSEYSDSHLTIVGDGKCLPTLKALVEQLQIADAVSFPGALPRSLVYDQLRRFHVFVVTSTFEGFCNAMVEAMAAGLPIVATDIPPLPEVLGEGCGMLIDPGCPQQLASRLSKLADDSEYAAQLARSAAQRAHAEFSLRSCAAQHTALYETFLGIAPNPTRP